MGEDMKYKYWQIRASIPISLWNEMLGRGIVQNLDEFITKAIFEKIERDEINGNKRN